MSVSTLGGCCLRKRWRECIWKLLCGRLLPGTTYTKVFRNFNSHSWGLVLPPTPQFTCTTDPRTGCFLFMSSYLWCFHVMPPLLRSSRIYSQRHVNAKDNKSGVSHPPPPLNHTSFQTGCTRQHLWVSELGWALVISINMYLSWQIVLPMYGKCTASSWSPPNVHSPPEHSQ